MKKVWNWLKESNRIKHLAGGIIIGLFARGFVCSLYASCVAATCLEYKDKEHGGKWDWVDFGLTVGGSMVGAFVNYIIFAIL